MVIFFQKVVNNVVAKFRNHTEQMNTIDICSSVVGNLLNHNGGLQSVAKGDFPVQKNPAVVSK